MLTVKVYNVTGGTPLASVADYEYEIYVNSRIIAYGTVEAHRRTDGWQALLRRVAEHEGLDEAVAAVAKA